jgi:hypothetical protein
MLAKMNHNFVYKALNHFGNLLHHKFGFDLQNNFISTRLDGCCAIVSNENNVVRSNIDMMILFSIFFLVC